MQQTLLTVGLILFGVAAAGVTGAAFLGKFAVRRTLRPLERVAETAAQVSELPWTAAMSTSPSGSPTRTPTPAPKSARSAPR
ncbi:hypothetical protein RPX00_46610 [Amycolatopsis sp. WGS_07]